MILMVQLEAPLVVLLLLLIIGTAMATERPEWSNESGSDICNDRVSNIDTAQEWVESTVIDTDAFVVSESGNVGGDTQTTGPTGPSPQAYQELEVRYEKSPTEAEAARVTTPALLLRQDQTQNDQLNARIQSLQQSAQQALQVLSDASRSVSQASQQLSQSVQQLSQSSSRLSGFSQQVSLELSVATQSVHSLSRAVSSAISSGSSAFASCTSSASRVLAVASNDAETKIGQALAQATFAKIEADREVIQAQTSAVTIAQAAAIIVGASVGSSLLTVIVVVLILRHRRKKRREREAQAEVVVRGHGGMYGGDSFNSMATAPMRDIKEPPAPPAQLVRIVDVSRNASGASSANRAAAAANIGGEHDSSLGDRPYTLGLPRRPTAATSGGEQALTTNYAQSAGSSARKSVVVGLSGPTAPVAVRREAQSNSDNEAEDERFDTGVSTTGSKTPTFSMFPKLDVDLKGMATSVLQRQQQQQLGVAPTLQTWLQTASTSPLISPGPESLSPPSPRSKSRLNDVKWPLVDNNNSNTTGVVGVGRSATDASRRYSRYDDDDDDGNVGQAHQPVAMIKDCTASRSPVVVDKSVVRTRGPGLPGTVRLKSSL